LKLLVPSFFVCLPCLPPLHFYPHPIQSSPHTLARGAQEQQTWEAKARETAVQRQEAERQRWASGGYMRANKFHFSPYCSCKGVPKELLQVVECM
jgi:hypothetical protein